MKQISEIKCVTKELREKLRAPLPPEAITPHPTKTYLSTIKAIFVTERLNDVFGIGVWQVRSDLVERAEKGTVVVKTALSIPTYGIYYESFGGNDNGGENSKNFDLGDAFKGAVTDSITKIASYMEIGIDVYKGKSTPKQAKPVSKAETAKEVTTKPTEWLNSGTPQWEHAVKRIKEGMKVEDLMKTFLISKKSQDELKKITPNEVK